MILIKYFRCRNNRVFLGVKCRQQTLSQKTKPNIYQGTKEVCGCLQLVWLFPTLSLWRWLSGWVEILVSHISNWYNNLMWRLQWHLSLLIKQKLYAFCWYLLPFVFKDVQISQDIKPRGWKESLILPVSSVDCSETIISLLKEYRSNLVIHQFFIHRFDSTTMATANEFKKLFFYCWTEVVMQALIPFSQYQKQTLADIEVLSCFIRCNRGAKNLDLGL